jgi:hypothetical protein
MTGSRGSRILAWSVEHAAPYSCWRSGGTVAKARVHRSISSAVHSTARRRNWPDHALPPAPARHTLPAQPLPRMEASPADHPDLRTEPAGLGTPGRPRKTHMTLPCRRTSRLRTDGRPGGVTLRTTRSSCRPPIGHAPRRWGYAPPVSGATSVTSTPGVHAWPALDARFVGTPPVHPSSAEAAVHTQGRTRGEARRWAGQVRRAGHDLFRPTGAAHRAARSGAGLHQPSLEDVGEEGPSRDGCSPGPTARTPG